MKKFVIAAATACSLVATAAAVQVDMGAATCADTKTWDANTAGSYLMWLDGYMSGKTGNTVLDTDGLQKLAEALDTFCGSNPDVKLLDAVNAAMGG